MSTKVILGKCRSRYRVESYSSVLSAERMAPERTTWNYGILSEFNDMVNSCCMFETFEYGSSAN
jgi:hypothetical protein